MAMPSAADIQRKLIAKEEDESQNEGEANVVNPHLPMLSPTMEEEGKRRRNRIYKERRT